MPATPVSFNTTDTTVTFTALDPLYVGTGPVTIAATAGEWLVVGTDRLAAGKPMDDKRIFVDIYTALDSDGRWITGPGVDLYRITADGTLAFAARAPHRSGVRALSINDKGRVLVADDQYVTCYQISGQQLHRQWQQYFPNARQVEFQTHFGTALSSVVVASEQRFDVFDQAGERTLSQTMSCRRFLQLGNNMLVIGQLGEASVVQAMHVTRNAIVHRSLPFLGAVSNLTLHGKDSALVLTRDFGLRLLTPLPYMDRRFTPPMDLDLSRWQTRDSWRKARERLVVAELALSDPASYVSVISLDSSSAALIRQNGVIETVAFDSTSQTVSLPSGVAGARDIIGGAAGAKLAVFWDRQGRLFRLKDNQLTTALSIREAGPWLGVKDRLLVTLGSDIHEVTSAGVGPPIYRIDSSRILDAVVDGTVGYALASGRLTLLQLNSTITALASLDVPENARRVFVGHGLACVVHGDRDVTTFDVTNPSRPKHLSHRTLELPLTWSVPHKYSDHERFRFQIDHMLIEEKRAIVAGGELYLFDLSGLRSGEGKLEPTKIIERRMGSFDDTAMAKRVDRVAPGLYHWNSDHLEQTRRAYLTELDSSAARPEVRACHVGTALTRDMVFRDGIAYVAAGRMGLRAVRFADGHAKLLGAVTAPNPFFEAAQFLGDVAYVKNGNAIERFRVQVTPTQPRTAFTFTPQTNDTLPRLFDGELEIDSPEYADARGWSQPLVKVKADLSDAAGWPRNSVAPNTVAIDPKLGHIKLADGRTESSRFLDKAPVFMWHPAGNWWMEYGPYHVSPAGEIGHGLLVMDVRDPDAPKVIGAGGNLPWGAYANRSLGIRGTHAYIGDNWFRFLIVVDLSDPTKPRYVRSVELRDADLPGLFDPQYRGLFRGDRLYMPTFRGLFEFDISDPEKTHLVKVHGKVPPVRWMNEQGTRGLDLDRGDKGFLRLVDLSNFDDPKELWKFAVNDAVGFTKVQGFEVQGNRLYVWGLTDPKSSSLATFEFGPGTPRLLGKAKLDGVAIDLRWREGHVLVGYDNARWQVMRYDGPESVVKLGQLDARDFAQKYQWQFFGPKPVVFDISDAELRGNVNMSHLQGRIVWANVGLDESGLNVFAIDWSDPNRPVMRKGLLGPNEEMSSLKVDAKRKTALMGGGGSYLVDVSDPTKLTPLWAYWRNFGWGAERTVGDGGAFISRTYSGILKQDFSHRDRPVITETGIFPGVLGPDPEIQPRGKTGFLLDSRFTRMHSDPIKVTPGSRLTLGGNVRFSPRINDASVCRIWVFSTAGDGRRTLGGGDATVRTGTTISVIDSSFDVPQDVEEVRVGLEIVNGPTWISELRLTSEGRQLLVNPDLTQPSKTPGKIPGWTVKNNRQSLSQAFSDEIDGLLYFVNWNNLLIYDTRSKTPLPLAWVPIEIGAEGDEGLAVTVIRRAGKKFAWVITTRGVVCVDVTDPRRPFRVSHLMLPWHGVSVARVAVTGNTLVTAPGYTCFFWTLGLYTVDISNPAKPRQVGFLPDNTTGFSVQGDRVYVNSYINGANIYDIKDPANPLLIEESIFDNTNAGAGEAWLVDGCMFRNMAAGMESWRVPMPPQSPRGVLKVLPTQAQP